jgi:hypothetical protein
MGLGAVVGRHPRWWPEAVAVAWAVRRRCWWSQAPHLPVPARDYLAWRRLTAYGDPTAAIPDRDLISFLRWRRLMRTVSR